MIVDAVLQVVARVLEIRLDLQGLLGGLDASLVVFLVVLCLLIELHQGVAGVDGARVDL
jgi:hypothetical protein